MTAKMTAAQRTELLRDLGRIQTLAERWADLLDPDRGPRSALRGDSAVLVPALDGIGREASKARSVLRLRSYGKVGS